MAARCDPWHPCAVTFAEAPLTARLRSSVDAVHRELVKFGAVGLLAFVVDAGSFNLLQHGLLGVAGPLEGKVLSAKTASVVLATIAAWLGNRYWTFRRRPRNAATREFVLFFALNAAGLGIALGCLGVSHYLLGLRTPLADNIAGNVVGLALGTLFRFWAYRRFVFPDAPEPETPAELGLELVAALPEIAPQHAELAVADLRALEIEAELLAEAERTRTGT